ncbi:MAG: MgtC/SapB family protein [Burkholderiales bacterium]|nr:MgtC/SapB family protein [Burkholderiales bacterium]
MPLSTLLGTLPSIEQWLRVSSQLIAAIILGALIGIQREWMSKPAGVRTHALVTLAAAIFTIVPTEAGMAIADLSRVIQGVATGIGFIGAGVILKRSDEGEIVGLTTSATIWAATAIGVAIGLGHIALSALGVVLIWIVLALDQLDRWIADRRGQG